MRRYEIITTDCMSNEYLVNVFNCSSQRGGRGYIRLRKSIAFVLHVRQKRSTNILIKLRTSVQQLAMQAKLSVLFREACRYDVRFPRFKN